MATKSTQKPKAKLGDYCITAAQHNNPDNHCASQFFIRIYQHNILSGLDEWSVIGWRNSYYVVDLLKGGETVYSAKANGKNPYLGDKIEFELRIAHNGVNYKIEDMPTKE
ncbi:MAG: hypothetical protein PW843_28340 [Azospirillaceae bacterium]|nr:hypothetical protein [Azospirillaceae bacterium]